MSAIERVQALWSVEANEAIIAYQTQRLNGSVVDRLEQSVTLGTDWDGEIANYVVTLSQRGEGSRRRTWTIEENVDLAASCDCVMGKTFRVDVFEQAIGWYAVGAAEGGLGQPIDPTLRHARKARQLIGDAVHRAKKQARAVAGAEPAVA